MNRPYFKNRRTAELNGECITYTVAAEAANELDVLWNPRHYSFAPEQAPPQTGEREATVPKKAEPQEQEDLNPTWLIGFAKDFRKSVQRIDRKMQGRVLEAMTDLVKDPLATRGDTVTALSGNFDGYWRYRIGDYRLLYYPDEATRTITLCEFAARGDVYM